MADVESLQLQITGDAKSATDSIQTLIDTLDKLNKATSGGCGLGAVADGMKKVGSASSSASVTNTRSAASFSMLAAKVTIAYQAFRKIGKTISSWINESNEYVENVNLFSVAMGEYTDSAMEYANQVSEVMGIDPSDWIRNQGLFMTLGTGFGIATDRAATMSKQLTQLGYDLSSFYNISVEEAMAKLKSGFSGELEPLRNLGYDLSQAKLEAIALSLGIDKSVSSMTQAEKAQLRYYAIMTQVTQAQGDMARTLSAPANQLRVLQAQVTQAARALGNLFIPALNAILPYVIAAVKVVTMLAQSLASIFGITLEVDFSKAGDSLGNVGEAAGDTSDGLDKATKNAKKLNKILLGIDELNVLPDASSGGAGGGNAGGVGGGGFDFALPTYDFLGDAVNQRVNEVVEKIKSWLGLTEEITSWADLFKTRLGEIIILVGAVATGLLAWKIMGLINSLGIAKIGLKTMGGVALAVASAFTFIGESINAWVNGVDLDNLITMIVSAGGVVGGLALAFGTTAAAIGAAVTGIIGFVVGLKDAITNGINWLNGILIGAGATAAGAGIGALIGSVGGPLGALIGLLVGLVVDGIILIVQNWEEVSAWISNACTNIGQFFSDLWAGIQAIWNSVASWFDTEVIQPVVGFFVDLWDEISTTASDCWDAIVDFFTPAFNWFSQLFDSIRQTISDVFYNIGVIASGCWTIIQAVWGVVSTWFNTKLITPVRTFFTNLWEGIKTAAITAWNGIKSVYTTISTWINTTIIQPVSNFFSGLWDGFINGAKNAWAGVKSVFSTVASFFHDTFQKAWSGIVKVFSVAGDIFKDIKDGIVSAFKKVVNGLIKGINKVVSVPFNALNSALGKLRDINIMGLTPFKNLKNISVPSIPLLASGGMVNSGQMFVAREAGPELVGTIGGRTAVANNDQIVDSVSQGVYRAFIQAMAESGGSQVVEAKVNDKVLFEVIVNRNRQETMRTGYSPLLGGV
jgi:phage-related protein